MSTPSGKANKTGRSLGFMVYDQIDMYYLFGTVSIYYSISNMPYMTTWFYPIDVMIPEKVEIAYSLTINPYTVVGQCILHYRHGVRAAYIGDPCYR